MAEDLRRFVDRFAISARRAGLVTRVADMQQDHNRFRRRLARLQKDNQCLRAQLDEERREKHRQAAPFADPCRKG